MHPSPNRFLQSLSHGDFELLRPHLVNGQLAHSAVLFEMGSKIERVYFPHGGVISLAVPLASGDMVEAGMIGHDGVIGAPAALDSATSLNRAVVQVPAACSAIEILAIGQAVASSRSLRISLYKRDQMLLAQAQQAAVCNAKHGINHRLPRFLLRIRDLLESDELPLTQEYLAQLIGVRRTSITLAAQALQSRHLIKYRRGHIRVLDVVGLTRAACECYEAVKSQEARLSAAPD